MHPNEPKALARMFLAAAMRLGYCVCGAVAEEFEINGEKVFRIHHKDDCPIITSRVVEDIQREQGES